MRIERNSAPTWDTEKEAGEDVMAGLFKIIIRYHRIWMICFQESPGKWLIYQRLKRGFWAPIGSLDGGHGDHHHGADVPGVRAFSPDCDGTGHFPNRWVGRENQEFKDINLYFLINLDFYFFFRL